MVRAIADLEIDLVFWFQAEIFRPLDHDQIAGIGAKFLESERFQFFAALQSVSIDVNQPLKMLILSLIKFHQHKGRTSDFFQDSKFFATALTKAVLPAPR